MAEFASVGSDDAEVWPKFVLAIMPGRDILEFSPFLNDEKSISIEMKAHVNHACLKAWRRSALKCSLRGIDDDRNRSPFRIVNLFGSETFKDAHWAVALRTFLNDRLV
jgi:hypothetical protein